MNPYFKSLKLKGILFELWDSSYEIEGNNIFQNLSKNSTPQELNLEECKLGKDSLLALFSNTTLTSLNLSNLKLLKYNDNLPNLPIDSDFLQILNNTQIRALNLENITLAGHPITLEDDTKDKIRNDRIWADLKL